MTFSWTQNKFPYSISLRRDNLDILCVSLKVPEYWLDFFHDFLSAEEKKRAERMRFQRIRKRYVAARGILRWLLCAYLDVPPERIVFTYGQNGKPDLADQINKPGLTFNMSHSDDMALYGVGLKRDVGVDIEKIREGMAFLKISERFFSSAEHEVLSRVPLEQIKHGFFNCWTRKEAYIKAKGESLSSSLGRFTVSLAPGEPAAMLAHETDPLEVSRWSFYDLDLDPAFKAAVVVEGTGFAITHVAGKTINFK